MRLHFDYLRDYYNSINNYTTTYYQPLTINNIGFKSGDLIYGMGKQRGNYIYNNIQFRGSNPQLNVSIIDQYRFNALDRLYSNRYFQPDITSSESFEISVRNHSKYRNILENTNPFSQSFDRNTYFSRKCKAGINWAKENGNTVHYILDDINMDMVINKNFYLQQGYSDADSVSGSELRWIYRNRHDPKVQKSVQFWRNGQPANAPWVDDPGSWSHYRPKSEALSRQHMEHHYSSRFVKTRQSYYDAILCEL